MEEKILTKHPQGKSGRRINKEKYEIIRNAILSSLKGKELTHAELMQAVRKRLKRSKGFSGSIPWYAETVKLDLEARKIIKRTETKPQRYKLIKNEGKK